MLTRPDAPSDRALIENLRLIDELRGRTSIASSAPITHGPRVVLARLVLGLAGAQAACGLGAVAVALVNGHAAATRIPQIVLALAFLIAGVLFGAATRRDPRSVWLLASMATGASAFARAALAGVPAASPSLDVLFRGLFPEAFAPAMLWQFAVEFPHVRRFTGFDVVARRATAGVWLLGSVLFFVNVLAAYGVVTDDVSGLLRRDDPGNAFWHLFAVAFLAAVTTVFVRSRRAPPAERRRVARFASAVAAGTMPFLLCGVARLVVPPIDAWFVAAGARRLWIDVVVVGTLTAAPILSLAVAVLDRPFARQASLYPSRERVARGSLTALLVAPLAVLLAAAYQARHVAIADVASDRRAWLLLASAAAGCLLLPNRAGLFDWLRGFRRTPDHRERLADAVERVRLARGRREIAVVTARAVCDAVRAGSARLLIESGDGSFTDSFGQVTPLRADAAVTRILRESRTALDLAPEHTLRALLPAADRDWIAENGLHLVVPLEHRDGTIAAVLAVGAKEDGGAFDRRDRWLVTTLTSAAAGAWDAAAAAAENTTPSPGDVADSAGDEAAFECVACGIVAGAKPLPCGCDDPPALASLPHRLAAKFLIERRIGSGAMGVVYLARDTTLGREVALKTLPDLRDDGVRRLREEAHAMAALNHEALATLYGLERWRRTPVLVVEYFPNGTLARRLAGGAMPAPAVVDIGVRLAEGLRYMHANGVLHRDVKPSNIAVASSGAPKLLDFGLATVIGAASRGAVLRGHPAGTPAYLAPEARAGATPGPGFDLWALSVVLLEAAIGWNPFAAARPARTLRRALYVDLANISAPAPAAATVLTAFFARALAPRPDDRFQTAHDLRAALEPLAGTLHT